MIILWKYVNYLVTMCVGRVIEGAVSERKFGNANYID